MNPDPRTTARTAREGLAQGLQLLQTPGLPAEFLVAAEPIARAMGSLMQAERSDGSGVAVRPAAEVALTALREALGKLQAIPSGHPAAEQAMAAVAGALGQVHGLSKLDAAPNFAPPPAAPNFAPPPAAPNFAPPPAAPNFAPPPAAPNFAPPPAQAGLATQADPFAAPAPPPSTGPDSLRPEPGMIEAELGAHSPSNFYKTLSGNDIVEHGGIFVATYAVPKLGTQIRLRVHLPGGYHFDAAGVVRWIREERGNADAPPGFGAQLLGISAEQRQLIQRYVRNREPLFYDDL